MCHSSISTNENIQSVISNRLEVHLSVFSYDVKDNIYHVIKQEYNACEKELENQFDDFENL